MTELSLILDLAGKAGLALLTSWMPSSQGPRMDRRTLRLQSGHMLPTPEDVKAIGTGDDHAQVIAHIRLV